MTAVLLLLAGSVLIVAGFEADDKSTVLSHDFGRVRSGAELQHAFFVRNMSFRPARIHHVRLSCSCTAQKYTDGTVLPFGKFRIETVMRTDGAEGEKKSSITVDLSNGKRSQLVLVADVQAARRGVGSEASDSGGGD